MSLGVMGGTFDPIHLGHLRAAESAREALGLEQVLFVPAAEPPHRGAPGGSALDRFAMVALATADNAAFVPSDLEIQRGGASYTIETLETLHSRHPGQKLVLIVGSDTLRELASHDGGRAARLGRRARAGPRAGCLGDRGPRAGRRRPQRPLSGPAGRCGLHRPARALLVTAPDEVRRAAEAALDKMASEVVILDVRQLASFTDFFLLASGSNPKQLVAIADSVRDALRALGLRPAHVEGYPRQEWMLMDYDWFVVHLFSDKSRSFYDLERLWGDAGRLEVSS